MRAHNIMVLLLAGYASLVSGPSDALVFDISYDTSVANAPSGFIPAFTYAVNTLTSTYDDPITITMNVGWNEIAGGPLDSGNIGQSMTTQPGTISYSDVRAALINDATSPADMLAISGLPVADPTGGRPFVMSTAESSALGLSSSGGFNGWVGFSSAVGWTFDPNNRAVPGAYDFIAVAEHELTHVMGRYGMTQNGCGGCLSPIDLFRYFAPGVRDFVPSGRAYFSIDGGVTSINFFHAPLGGDLSDWIGNTPDAFNALISSNEEQPFSPGDMTLVDVLGYDPVAPVPEPTSMAILGVSVVGFAFFRYAGRGALQW
jgi:hypothetical protein